MLSGQVGQRIGDFEPFKQTGKSGFTSIPPGQARGTCAAPSRRSERAPDEADRRQRLFRGGAHS